MCGNQRTTKLSNISFCNFYQTVFLLLQIIHRPGCKHFSRTDAARCWILKTSFRAVSTKLCSHEFWAEAKAEISDRNISISQKTKPKRCRNHYYTVIHSLVWRVRWTFEQFIANTVRCKTTWQSNFCIYKIHCIVCASVSHLYFVI